MSAEMFALRVGMDRLRARLTRLEAVCTEVLYWAVAQDEERSPEWVDRLADVLENKA